MDSLITATGLIIPKIPDTTTSIPNWLFVTLTLFMLTVFMMIIQFLLRHLVNKFEKFDSNLSKNSGELKDSILKLKEDSITHIQNLEESLENIFKQNNEIVIEIVKSLVKDARKYKEDISKILDEQKISCENRSMESKDSFEMRVLLVNDSIDRTYNTLIEILKHKSLLPCNIDLALSLFDAVLNAHCLKKGIITAEALHHRQYVTKEATIKALSNIFKDITESEVQILSKITYTNNNKLSEVLSPVLDRWDTFVEHRLKPIVESNWDERNTLVIQHNVYQELWEEVKPMKALIRIKGGADD